MSRSHPQLLRPLEGTHTLARGGSIGLPPRPALVVACTQGLLLIRQRGGIDDHLLRAGQCWQASLPGPVVVRALADAQFSVGPA